MHVLDHSPAIFTSIDVIVILLAISPGNTGIKLLQEKSLCVINDDKNSTFRKLLDQDRYVSILIRILQTLAIKMLSYPFPKL